MNEELGAEEIRPAVGRYDVCGLTYCTYKCNCEERVLCTQLSSLSSIAFDPQ